jgi:hypothetical protein
VERGYSTDNPATDLDEQKLRRKHLELPSPEKFAELVDTMRKA